jgi:hypothetical protein
MVSSWAFDGDLIRDQRLQFVLQPELYLRRHGSEAVEVDKQGRIARDNIVYPR